MERPLVERITEAIRNEKFTFWEVQGFQCSAERALVAGAIVGYKLATDDFLKTIESNRLHTAGASD